MTKDQALKHALEKFEYMNHIDSIFHGEFDFQINAIKKALAQQAEPVAYEPVWNNLPSNKDVEDAMRLKRLSQLITTPPRQPLTDEQILSIIVSIGPEYHSIDLARAIEAAHGIKGEA